MKGDALLSNAGCGVGRLTNLRAFSEQKVSPPNQCEILARRMSRTAGKMYPDQNFTFSRVKVKVKVKFSLEQTTKTQTGSRCIALLFLQPRR